MPAKTAAAMSGPPSDSYSAAASWASRAAARRARQPGLGRLVGGGRLLLERELVVVAFGQRLGLRPEPGQGRVERARLGPGPGQRGRPGGDQVLRGRQLP